MNTSNTFGYPAQSSTATLTIQVCSCKAIGSLLTCSPGAIFLPVSLSAGTLMATLLCIALLIGKLVSLLFCLIRHHQVKDTPMTSKEDIRDNVIHYDDEGGGEADTRAFNMGTLRNAEMIGEFIEQRLEDSQQGYSAPPYDSLATYAYEGDGSEAGSLSSIESFVIDNLGDFSSLGDWGLPFKTLAGILDKQQPSLSKD
uniref:Cadherin Y-type LIR-motif domain-containing protein n=1 Tax=Amphilophus citrinellus TaxID=61819 RepID=A0A3Q0SXZ7_AMPCI